MSRNTVAFFSKSAKIFDLLIESVRHNMVHSPYPMTNILNAHNPDSIEQSAIALQNGLVVIYPTDTIYGLGADATNPEAVEKIFEIKKRTSEKALSICIADSEDIQTYAHITPLAEKLISHFLPGPLTLVLEKKDTLAENLSSDATIGIRIPQNDIVRNIIREAGCPITATSANISGETVDATVSDIATSFNSLNIPCALNAGPLSGEPSTVIDARNETPVLLREGALSFADILEKI